MAWISLGLHQRLSAGWGEDSRDGDSVLVHPSGEQREGLHNMNIVSKLQILWHESTALVGYLCSLGLRVSHGTPTKGGGGSLGPHPPILVTPRQNLE